MNAVMRTLKPHLERQAERLGKLLIHNSYVKPMTDQLDEGVRNFLELGVRSLGGYILLQRSWFKKESSYRLANELVDALFSGIGEGLTEPWEDGKGKFDEKKFQHAFNARMNGINCEVALDRNGLHYHQPMCPIARQIQRGGRGKQQQQSQVLMGERLDAEIAGRSPADCCWRWFATKDEEARAEHTGTLATVLMDVDPIEAEEFQRWLSELDAGRAKRIKPYVMAITRTAELRLLMRKIRRQRDEYRELHNQITTRLTAGEEVDPDAEAAALLDSQTEEMVLALGTIIKLSEPKKEKFFSKKHVSGLYKRAKKCVEDKEEGIATGLEQIDEGLEQRVSTPLRDVANRASEGCYAAYARARARLAPPPPRRGFVGILRNLLGI
ncbi:MAG: hypothetical protein PHW53_01315 [Patescibacteria group bacterium]|nr:hypothetical protein [Patescibacteria group bacterium]